MAALVLVLAACGGSDEPAGGGSATATTASATTAPAARSPIAGVKAWIAYTGLSDRGPDGVFLVRTNGSEDHEIVTEVPGLRFHPDFSRDGKRLAFDQRTSDNDPDQVYVAAADGSGARQLAKCQAPKCGGLWEPAWSPDGKKLAIATSYGFHPGAPSDRFGNGIIDVATGRRWLAERHARTRALVVVLLLQVPEAEVAAALDQLPGGELQRLARLLGHATDPPQQDATPAGTPPDQPGPTAATSRP